MARLHRVGRRRKRKSGEFVAVRDREQFDELEVDVKVELIQRLIPLGLLHVESVLQEEVRSLVGARYAHRTDRRASRHGTNPGTVRLGGRKVPMRVPRVRGEDGEIPLASYRRLHEGGATNERLLRQVLYGISCRNYESAAESIPGSLGVSSSSVSRTFVKESSKQLAEFQERDLSGEDYVALFIDGKAFADETMVLALGITITGEKRPLGFVQTSTENAKVVTSFLRSLLSRGLDVSEGILAIVDGAKGLRAAVKQAFKRRAVVQRCMWHKRENVVSYLPRGEQESWRRRLQKAMSRPTYDEARAALKALESELDEINQSAAASLREGLEEILTLHRLGVFAKLGRSFKTTNCLENVNGLVAERCGKVDNWKNSNQRHRWLAAALIDIEPRLRRVMGMTHLPELREAVQRELGLECSVANAA